MMVESAASQAETLPRLAAPCSESDLAPARTRGPPYSAQRNADISVEAYSKLLVYRF